MPDVSPVTAPAGWDVLTDLLEGLTWAAREPRPDGASGTPDRFLANLVLTEVSTGGLGFRDWQAGTDELLPRALDDYLVVDLEKLEIDGHPGGRRLAHHAGPNGEALTMEQWFTLVDGIGHTLTATVETWRYDQLADDCAAAAATWRPGEGV